MAKENFVRQGAVLALSFILIQQTEASSSKVGEFRRVLTKVYFFHFFHRQFFFSTKQCVKFNKKKKKSNLNMGI